MPVNDREKLFGLPGPQNSAVLMDIITKLKHDLQQSRTENNKLVDQLNCLIVLVKRAWSGEQGAMLHLANICGMEPPCFTSPVMDRNTPIPTKSRAVQNWERLTIKMLQHEYEAIKHDIQEKQKLHLHSRQQYMNYVLTDHTQEMSKLNLHKKITSNVHDVDKQFLRCFSAKSRIERKARSTFRSRSHSIDYVPKSADMVDKSDVKVEDLLGMHSMKTAMPQPCQNDTNNATEGTFKMINKDYERRFNRPMEQYDDPNRYKQNNLFDADVVNGPYVLDHGRGDIKSSPFSSTAFKPKRSASLLTRPKSAIFMTEENKPDRPLKYETTRPESGKHGKTLPKRQNSAPVRRTMATQIAVKRKEFHCLSGSVNINNVSDNQEINGAVVNKDEHQCDNETSSVDLTKDENDNREDVVKQKPPLSVSVKKNDPVNRFVEELKEMVDMEDDFKRAAIQLQKKLGLETDGFVF